MKKLLLILALLWFGLVSFQNSVKANDYTTAVIGHVIQNHKEIDHGKLLESEMNRLMHSVSIEMVSILQKHLPYIMDGVMTELKLELDKTHKCLLLKDSKIKDKDCE
jgi:predicted thioredoxin/glutaredoxin